MGHVRKKSALGCVCAVCDLLLLLQVFHIPVMIGVIDQGIKPAKIFFLIDKIVLFRSIYTVVYGYISLILYDLPDLINYRQRFGFKSRIQLTCKIIVICDLAVTVYRDDAFRKPVYHEFFGKFSCSEKIIMLYCYEHKYRTYGISYHRDIINPCKLMHSRKLDHQEKTFGYDRKDHHLDTVPCRFVPLPAVKDDKPRETYDDIHGLQIHKKIIQYSLFMEQTREDPAVHVI